MTPFIIIWHGASVKEGETAQNGGPEEELNVTVAFYIATKKLTLFFQGGKCAQVLGVLKVHVKYFLLPV